MIMTTSKALVLQLGTIATVVGLFFSPWMFGYSDAGVAAWSAWLTAVLILVFGTANAAGRAIWAPWALLILGMWTIVAPLTLGFGVQPAPFFAHIIAGLLALAGGWATINWAGTSDLQSS
jgi:hypothetical protein